MPSAVENLGNRFGAFLRKMMYFPLGVGYSEEVGKDGRTVGRIDLGYDPSAAVLAESLGIQPGEMVDVPGMKVGVDKKGHGIEEIPRGEPKGEKAVSIKGS